MKFKPGDGIDSAHCTALKHEFLRCEDAFKDFETYAKLMIMNAQIAEGGGSSISPEENRLIAYKTYNAYSRFLHHLYEFMLGEVAREIGDTATLRRAVTTMQIVARLRRTKETPALLARKRLQALRARCVFSA